MKLLPRIILIAIMLIVGGLLYSLAGPEEEWDSIPLIGAIIVATLIPWEILFLGKRKNKQKK